MLKKARLVKEHYRRLPNGRIIHIDEHWDKRDKAAMEVPGAVTHADETGTTVVTQGGKQQTYAHSKTKELSTDEIHRHLMNRVVTPDKHLAMHMIAQHYGLNSAEDFDNFLEGLPGEDKKAQEAYFKKNYLDKMMDKNAKELGGVKPAARAYVEVPHYREYIDSIADAKGGAKNLHDMQTYAFAHMLKHHGDEAANEVSREERQVEEAKLKGPKDAPKIPLISSSLSFFPHQAEVLAKLDVLDKAVIDVDMGGGKGLLLPADALNLMAKGKVKKPLIVAPGPTIDQNAAKIHEYTDGKFNVFCITNATISKHYKGDIDKLIADIEGAPANTIFMASYDVFAHQEAPPPGVSRDEMHQDDLFARALALGAAGWDLVSCDESHLIKNPTSSRFKAMQYLTGAKYRRMASGTFVSNDASDVYGQLKWLYPDFEMSFDEFKKTYGYREVPKVGKTWDAEGLKRLRNDLADKGVISLRRSNWLDKLPPRDDNLSIVKMDPKHAAINDAAIEGVLADLEDDLDPDTKRHLAYDEIDNYLEDTPKLRNALETLGGITDYPDIVADMVEGKYEALKKGSKELGVDIEPDAEEARDYLNRFPPALRKKLLGLKGMVSPKAKDLYKKLDEHFKDPKNGKFIVFCQRRFSAAHIMSHMPDHLKKDAVYFDASKKEALDQFVKEGGRPRIIVAVDASIKDGINLQMANGMYRFDSHFAPGSQEQSYARIYRFGQTRPVKIHVGCVDGGVDVPKYCRMISKHHQNMQVTSDLPEDRTFVTYRLSLDNIRSQRDAETTNEYQSKLHEMHDFEVAENRKVKGQLKGDGYKLGSSAAMPKGEIKTGGAYYSPPTKAKLKKSIIGDLSSTIAADKAGGKITKIGQKRLGKVKAIIAGGIKAKRSIKRIAAELEREVSAKREDWRNWKLVAQTEVTDSSGHASYKLLTKVFGKGHRIYRDTHDCCPCSECERLFGPPGRPRYYRTGEVPVRLRGSLHPGCRCSPWRSIDEPDLTKAALHIPGLVKREWEGGNWIYSVSDGKGRWFLLDSLSGLGLVSYVVRSIPFVQVDSKGGYVLARHGHGKPRDHIIRLLAPSAIGNTRFYPANPFEGGRDREYFVSNSHTFDDYIVAVMKILPAVIKMPEYWQGGKKINYITDFMGYVTLTNWWILIPGAVPPEAVVFEQKAGDHYHDTHSAVKMVVKKLMAAAELAKEQG